MIRIRLINEGRVVKQITSRLHEGVVLEQIKKYKDPYDTIQIVEGELSEGAKEMLHHVAKKIVPAAMAAGMAMSGASNAQAQGGANPHYPGLNHSVGQQLSDIFSPNYKELRRQREHQRSTERQVWDAEQNEIRKQRVNAARAAAGGGQQHVIYDQSRLSQDGKSYIIYGIDNKVRRIPVAGTEYMHGDSQRLPHYITSGGNVLYVRHPHAVTESVVQGVAEGEEDAFMSKLGGLKSWQVVIMNNYYRGKYSDYSGRYYYVLASSPEEARQVVLDNADAILQDLLSMKSVNGKKILPRSSAIAITDKRIGDIKDGTEAGRMSTAGFKRMFGPQGPMMVKLSGGAVVDVQGQEQGVAEGYTVTRGIDRERYQERPGLEGPFSTRSGKVVYYDPKEGKYYDPETDFYIGHEDYAKMDEGTDPNTQSHADAFKSETDTMKPGTTKYVGRKGGKEVTAKKDEQGNVKFYHRDGIKGPLKRVAEGLPKAQDGRYNPDGSKKQAWHKDPRWQQHAKDWENDPKNIYSGVGKKKVKEQGVAEGFNELDDATNVVAIQKLSDSELMRYYQDFKKAASMTDDNQHHYALQHLAKEIKRRKQGVAEAGYPDVDHMPGKRGIGLDSAKPKDTYVKTFHASKEKEAQEFAKKHGYIVKKHVYPKSANNSQPHEFQVHKNEQGVAEGVAESLPLNDALKVLRQYGAENLKTTTNELHFYKNGKAFSVPLTFNDDATRSVPLSSLNSATRSLKGQGVAESDPNATVGTIPSTGTSGGTGRTQFAPTGKTTNAKFNKNGQIELDTEQEDDGSVNLDADAVKQLQQAGVQIKEGEDSPVASAIARRIMTQRLDLLQQYGPVLVTQAIDEVADFVGDVEEIGSSDVSGWVKHVEQMLRDNPPAAFNEGSDTLEGILSKYSADYAKFKAGGDIDENQDFFAALYAYYSESGEMPYGVQKARDGDPYEWITQRLDHESGVSPVIEAEGDEASADQNIIMQIRKASDYEKPTRIELADGTESVIAPNIARQLLDKFDKMKPDSKELLQNTLNTEEGFKEIIAYFGGGVREQAVARVGNIMQAAMAEAGYGRYDRRDAYQRDYDSSVAGMGKRQSYAYQQDGGANDEGWDQPERSYQAPEYTYYIRFKDSGKVYKQKGVPKSFPNKKAANAYALAMMKNNPALQGNLLLTVTGEDNPTA